MTRKRAKEVVKYFFNCLREKEVNVSRIIVFGSQAKGSATYESDIDIVVVSEDFKRKSIFKRADMTKDALCL
jgi:predicted nucleotidyltransferase